MDPATELRTRSLGEGNFAFNNDENHHDNNGNAARDTTSPACW